MSKKIQKGETFSSFMKSLGKKTVVKPIFGQNAEAKLVLLKIVVGAYTFQISENDYTITKSTYKSKSFRSKLGKRVMNPSAVNPNKVWLNEEEADDHAGAW